MAELAVELKRLECLSLCTHLYLIMYFVDTYFIIVNDTYV